jgi:hypothetical protein
MTVPTQPPLIRQVNTWLHYIGGYYRSTEQFIREAQAHGVTRRIPAQVARGMQYGDRVVLLRWGGRGKVWAFAEMRIASVALEGELSRKVGERLAAEGRASFTEGGEVVERECGCYLICGVWMVSADLPEVMDIALEIAAQDGQPAPFAMIGGTLAKVYSDPALLSPAPRFTRGFIRADAQATFEFHGQAVETPGRTITAITDYRKRARGSGRTLPRLPEMTP